MHMCEIRHRNVEGSIIIFFVVCNKITLDLRLFGNTALVLAYLVVTIVCADYEWSVKYRKLYFEIGNGASVHDVLPCANYLELNNSGMIRLQSYSVKHSSK